MKNIMKNIWLKISAIIIISLLGLFYIIPWQSIGLDNPLNTLWIQSDSYKLWLDLKWWIELDYKVNLDERKKEKWYDKKREKDIIEQLKLIVDKRISSLWIDDSVITTANYSWEQHIIVQIPLKWKNLKEDRKNIERVKAAVWKVVKIMFKEPRIKKLTPKDWEERKNIAKKLLEEEKKSKYSFFVLADQYRDSYDRVFDWNTSLDKKDFKEIFKNVELKEWLVPNLVETNSWANITKINPNLTEDWFFVLNIEKIQKDKINFDYAYIAKKPSDWIPAKDSKWRVLDDKYFKKAWVAKNQAWQPEVELVFNSIWWQIFGDITEKASKRPSPSNIIAIFVWWELLTAPSVHNAIFGWRAVITWNYTPKEAQELANNINTWVIPAPIYLTSERSIDPKLGWNALDKLIKAWFAWLILIFVFLILIYRLSWIMASLALIIYTILVLAIIKFFGNILTLASIAWLILSIWIAIDANVLIFERIKDELRDHPNQDRLKSIQVWFEHSWSAIWDSNITGLIISIILYIFWVNMIKWFWLMLGIWIVVSLFTAMWVSRIFILALWKSKMSDSIFIGFSNKQK